MGPLFLALVASVTLQPLHGPYATLEAACGGAPIKNPTENSGFCMRLGAWQAALRQGDEWFVGPLPLQDGVTPERVEGTPPVLFVRFAQHAFDPAGVDVDGEWSWPCAAGACLSEAVPVELRDRSKGVGLDVAADVLMAPDSDGKSQLDVVFRKLRVTGRSARAAAWRVLVERLRGHHVLTHP